MKDIISNNLSSVAEIVTIKKIVTKSKGKKSVKILDF